MTADPFFAPLLHAEPRGDEPTRDGQADASQNDVDQWFARAASGQTLAGHSDSAAQSELLGAAGLPLDGDLVRPARQPAGRLARSATRRSNPARAAARPRRAWRSRALAGAALLTTALLIAVVSVMRPAHPVRDGAPPPGVTEGTLSTAIGLPARPAADRIQAVATRAAQQRRQLRRARASRRQRPPQRAGGTGTRADRLPSPRRPPPGPAPAPGPPRRPYSSCEFDLC